MAFPLRAEVANPPASITIGWTGRMSRLVNRLMTDSRPKWYTIRGPVAIWGDQGNQRLALNLSYSSRGMPGSKRRGARAALGDGLPAAGLEGIERRPEEAALIGFDQPNPRAAQH